MPAHEKLAVTIGMGLTETQGGTDVRANTTRAEPVGAPGSGRRYTLTGHKWFMSAPIWMPSSCWPRPKAGFRASCCRAFEHGCVNALRFQRLKDKLGNRSNASSKGRGSTHRARPF